MIFTFDKATLLLVYYSAENIKKTKRAGMQGYLAEVWHFTNSI